MWKVKRYRYNIVILHWTILYSIVNGFQFWLFLDEIFEKPALRMTILFHLCSFLSTRKSFCIVVLNRFIESWYNKIKLERFEIWNSKIALKFAFPRSRITLTESGSRKLQPVFFCFHIGQLIIRLFSCSGSNSRSSPRSMWERWAHSCKFEGSDLDRCKIDSELNIL